MRLRSAFHTLLFGAVLAASISAPAAAQLQLSPADLRIDQSTDGGYIISVRASGIGSVLLTESTEDPNWELASHTFRDPGRHPMNANEPRQNPDKSGRLMEPDPRGSYIIDSTPEPDEQFGSAFKLFVPYIVNYGFPGNRNGVVQVLDGTYLSIRAFELEHGDYRGTYQDNPFTLSVVQLPPPPEPEPAPRPAVTVPTPEPEEDLSEFMDATVVAFRRAAEETEADIRAARHSEELPGLIRDILGDVEGRALDLVIVLDTTQSMEHSLNVIKRDLVSTLRPLTDGYETLRLGFVAFRDYFDEYLNRPFPMVETLDDIQQYLNRSRATGGRDIPEAIYEALFAALTHYEWTGDVREIILVGDAPPHPLPRGSITEEIVYDQARELGVRINTIMLPHP